MKPSSSLLVLVNVIPLLGVSLLGWSVLDVLIVYWTETVVIGVVNLRRMAKSQPGHSLLGILTIAANVTAQQKGADKLPALFFPALKLGMIAFFSFHYGLFCLAHLFGLLVVFGEPDESGGFSLSLQAFWQFEYLLAVVPIALSHTFSYFSNFIGREEHKNIGLVALMGRPYGRIVTMQIVIISGAFLVESLGSPQMALAVLVLTKTAFDLRSHHKERQQLATVPQRGNTLKKYKTNRASSPVSHRELLGNWKVVSQDPSHADLVKMMTNSSEADMSGLDQITTTYQFSESEIVVDMQGPVVFGGPTRMRYAVQGDRLLIQRHANGVLARIFAAFQPDYFEFDCRGSRLELISSPIAALQKQRIRYDLELVKSPL